MAEDVDILRGYDEDLGENPFFKTLQTKYKQLYDEAAKNRWTICIPRQGTLPRASHTLTNIETHILKTIEEKEHTFKTVNGKEVQVSGEFILTTEGFQDVKSVQILFEETFFNQNNESYVVLCVEQPLDGGSGVSAEPVVTSLETLQACSEFLWASSGNKQTQKQIDEIVKLFNNQYQQLEGESLRHLMDAANAIYTRAMQAALKNWHLRRLARTSSRCMDNVKLAIETYIMKGLHGALFKAISSITGHEDAALNKTTRNLADVQIKDLGIRTELCANLPKGRRILSSLNKFKTPLEKFHCLKKAVTFITDRKMKEGDGASDAVTADDLLPALVFLVIKADVPNWLANITFLHNFHFSKCGYSEFQFYLSSIEAAVEHVRGGFVDISKGVAPAKRFISPWQQVDSDNIKSAALERLFEFAATGNEAEVKALLDSADEVTAKENLCHPLCSCDKCEKLQTSKRNDPSAVTVFSRDDMGRTVLHVTAEYGCGSLAYELIKRGAVVNTMDYHGTTPLHLACQKGHNKVALILIHYKADVNAPDNDGNTPLHLCTANGHDQCAKALVFSDMQFNFLKVDAANEHGDSPLHLASRWGYAELVKLLLENGASIGTKNKNKETPLDCSHNKQVSELLLDAAVKNMEMEPEFPFLPRRSASVSKGNSSRRPLPVQEAPPHDKQKEVDVFLRTVADGDIELVRFKLGLSDDEDEEDAGETLQSEQDLCHPLCQCDKCSKWQKLSSQAVDKLIHANVVNEDGISPLHLAAVRGYEEITSLLLRRGAKPSQKNNIRRQTPLHLACQYNHPTIVSQLLNYQAKLNVKDYKGNTPLHFCCINGHLDPASVLIKGEANVNITNDRGNTPLHEAARWNFVELVRVLVEHGASVTVRNNMHLTPVQYAQHDDVVRVLAQTEIKTEEDRTPEGTGLQSPEKTSSALAKLERQLSSSPSKLQAMDVTSERFKISYEAFSENADVGDSRTPAAEPVSVEFGAESLPPNRLKLNKIFEQLERGRMEKLEQITKAVRTFDRRKSLKRADTVDKSFPLLDGHLLHQLSIQRFDTSSLRKTTTRDRSGPMIDVDVDYEGDVSDEESGTRHHEKGTDDHEHAQTDHVGDANKASGTRCDVTQENFRDELERRHVGKLREINKAVQEFDRRSFLKKTDTVDKSFPLLDLQLRHQFSIENFDKSVLRKANTRDRSRPIIDLDNDYDGDVSDEGSGTSGQDENTRSEVT